MSGLFCVSFVFHVLLFNQQLHPQKLTCPLKSDHFNRKHIFQPLIFRGLSLVFWGEKFSVPNTSPRSCWQLWWHVRALPPRGPCVPGWSSDCRSAIRTSIFSPTQEKAHSTRNLGEFDMYIIIYDIYTDKFDQISFLKSKPLSWIEFHAKYLDDLGLTSPGSSLFHIFTPTSRSDMIQKELFASCRLEKCCRPFLTCDWPEFTWSRQIVFLTTTHFVASFFTPPTRRVLG